MTFLLDTNVISELVSPRRNPDVVSWLASLDNHQLFVSVITIGELRYGIQRLAPSKRRQQLTDWLENEVLGVVGANLLPVDLATINYWATLSADLEAAGRRIPFSDSLIAATAGVHRLTLATRNVKDFQPTNVALFNPWLTD